MAQVPVQHQNVMSGENDDDATSSVPGAAGGENDQFLRKSLYVGDLDPDITDAQLYDLFNQVGQVVSVMICRDSETYRSLGYGYVNYSNPQDAARALDILNFTPLNSKTIRVMYSNRDPSIRRSGQGNIFIKNLDKGIDNKALYDTFSAFGNILSCKVATDSSGESKGYGFIHLESEEAAQKAIEQLNGMLMNDKQVYVGPFVRKQDRGSTSHRTNFSNVYVKNLSESTTAEDLKKTFGEFGNITSAVVMTDADGKSKCFGFVNFESAEDAARSIEVLNGKNFDGKEWYVANAQKKSEREMELKLHFEQRMKEAADKYQRANLYVKNLDETIGDHKLQELFSEFGTITSCKVMRGPNGISRGSGFVAFSSPEEASRALLEMNGKMIVNKPLYVALAQRKEDRRARMQAQFAQMRPMSIAPSVVPWVPMYSPGVHGVGRYVFSSQAPPAMIPSQPGFGYQQQFVPGMRPGGPPMPNFYMPMVPMVQQRQQGQRPGGRLAGTVQQAQQPVPLMQQQNLPRNLEVYRYPFGRGIPDSPMPVVGDRPAGTDQQAQQPVPLMQQQNLPRNLEVYRYPFGSGIPDSPMPVVRDRLAGTDQQAQQSVPLMQQQILLGNMEVYRYPFSRGIPDAPMPEVGGMFPVQSDMGGEPVQETSIYQPIPIESLASALQNATPEEQKTMLGESLYPLVYQLEPDNAPKVTGMLLEMDHPEVLHLLESPEAMKAKVGEAMEVIRIFPQQQQQIPEEMASLSLNDNLVP